jgi:protein-tyrosine kinase
MGRIFDAMQRVTANKDTILSESPFIAMEPELVVPPEPEAELDGARPLVLLPDPKQRLVALEGQRTLGAEKVRILAARLRHMQEQRAIKKLLITSSVKDEGKTVLSANLAISFAKMKQRVLLIDGDFHQAGAGHLMGVDGSPGLMDWYRTGDGIETFLRRVDGLSLWFLPTGALLDQPVEMLQSQKTVALLAHLAASFDWVCIDTPPSAPLADSSVWAKLADAILLVTRDGKTPKRLLKKVVASLDQGKLLGIVLNDCSDPDQQYYHHYYSVNKTG